MSNRLTRISWFTLLLMLVGCTAAASEPDLAAESLPTPTTFLFFKENENIDATIAPVAAGLEGAPTVASLFSERNTPTPRPSPTPLPTFPPLRPAIARGDVFTATVFDDELNDNWEIVARIGAQIDASSEIRVYKGQRSIAFTPESDFSTLFFAVKPTTTVAYPFQQVLGVNFWINGGDDFIQLDQLAIAVLGSNAYTHWEADDNSVRFPQGESFSETRLYFLGLNRSIPPETWVQVFLPLDTLIYDPEYNHVVGFYLKNDVGFRNTVYVDEVSLIMLEGGESPVLATATRTPTPSSTPSATAVAEPTGTPGATAEPDSAACVVSPPAGWERYEIQAGETISSLAVARSVAPNFVISINCLDLSGIISVGQQIWLPPLPTEETPPEPSP